jgi:hypothetical protein
MTISQHVKPQRSIPPSHSGRREAAGGAAEAGVEGVELFGVAGVAWVEPSFAHPADAPSESSAGLSRWAACE